MLEGIRGIVTNPMINNPFKEILGYADDRHKLKLEGDLAWVLIHLMQAGRVGCTPVGLMAPGLSLFIGELRKAGVAIDTVRTKQPMQGGFRLRYILRSNIIITGINLTKAYNYAE
ncbi:winged helix domain-containing protein [Microvirga sp. P5_D2]